MARELILYADESDQDGQYYGNFYGGAVVWSTDLEEVSQRLAYVKLTQNLYGEVKWQKVTGQYLAKYLAFSDEIFDLLTEGKLRLRVMFTHNYITATGLSDNHRKHEYEILYYQFVKYAFGLEHAALSGEGLRLRIYLDKLPSTTEKIAAFKDFLGSLNRYGRFRRAGVSIPKDQIAEVSSHDHDILQAVDLVLGSMQFRLNDKHLARPPGQARRGKRTIAKEKLYKHINRRIRQLYPNFNIGISTGINGDVTNRWHHAYRHWEFRPSKNEPDHSQAKPKKARR